MNRSRGDLVENLEEARKAHRRRFGAAQLDTVARRDSHDRAQHREPMISV